MTKSQSAFIFIPDISGFSTFVNETEISHSQHIIAELLETIIDADKLGLTISEIEGDAVFSYKLGHPPSMEQIIEQCSRTFILFHNYIRRYEAERICRCGACRTAVNLSLKFIAHAGPVEFIRVKSHEKLHGSDIILAHRLLKNPIPENEYILLTDSLKPEEQNLTEKQESWIRFIPGSTEYPDAGPVNFTYIPLAILRNQVKEPDPITIPGLGPDKIILKREIHASLDTIYENFSNLDKRLEWDDEIREIILKDTKINKAGAVHSCLIGSDNLEFQTIGMKEDETKITYGERLDRFKGLKDILTIFTFEKKEPITLVTVEIDFQMRSPITRLFKPLIRKMLSKQTSKGLYKLKQISEKG
jgi:hypothetical protein